MFGGNSNWRGPIWMPMQLMLIRALVNQYAHLGNSFTVESAARRALASAGILGGGVGRPAAATAAAAEARIALRAAALRS